MRLGGEGCGRGRRDDVQLCKRGEEMKESRSI